MKLITEKSYNKNQQIEKEIKLFKFKRNKSEILNQCLKNYDNRDISLQKLCYLLSQCFEDNEKSFIKRTRIKEYIELEYGIFQRNYSIVNNSFFLSEIGEYMYLYTLLLEVYKDFTKDYRFFLEKISIVVEITYDITDDNMIDLGMKCENLILTLHPRRSFYYTKKLDLTEIIQDQFRSFTYQYIERRDPTYLKKMSVNVCGHFYKNL